MKRNVIIVIIFFIATLSYGQVRKVVGTYSNIIPKIHVKFNVDSTFEYVSENHPTFNRWENFSEKGIWTLSGDTIILNPNLTKKTFVEFDFKEQKISNDTTLLLTFNHIRRYFDVSGNVIETDTLQIERLDYAFNKLKKKNRTRVANHFTTRCVFAGYIPNELITTSRTISIPKPTEKVESIFIGCYELRGTKEFKINNSNSNCFTLNIYSNYYQDGQIRQMKFLIKNNRVLYTLQKENGKFEKDTIWFPTDAKLIKQEGGN